MISCHQKEVKMMKSISIGEAGDILGVSITTLRRWDREGKLKPNFRTFGGHRRYHLNEILSLINKETQENRIDIGYARVSSHDQKEDLKRQSEFLREKLKEKGSNYEIIEDLGSGLNFKKKGLKKLIRMIITSQIDKIYITHKDRLLRFGTELIISISKEFGTEVVIINQEEKSFEMELAGDVLEIITVFSARLYGKRSHKNKKQLIKNKNHDKIAA
jgi:predicted site-specific integrase-resolvase